MSFTKALYYPSIDIYDQNWLKTAVLFWDEINTIVPSSLKQPYNTRITQYLADQGILLPIRVDPGKDFIEELTTDAINYLETNEGHDLISSRILANMYSNRQRVDRIDEMLELYPEKLPYEVQHILHDRINKDGFFEVDSGFAMFYMTLLANKLCEMKSVALLSNNVLTTNLLEKVKLDNKITFGRGEEYFHPKKLSQGLLTNMVIASMNFSESTNLKEIVDFKKTHADELGLFRTNIYKLTQSVSEDISFEALQQRIQDIYKDEFLPSYNNLKKALSGSNIKWISENITKISFISTSSTALPIVLLGASVPVALLAGIGISLISSVIMYNADKKEKLRTNPYSYLLEASRRFR